MRGIFHFMSGVCAAFAFAFFLGGSSPLPFVALSMATGVLYFMGNDVNRERGS